MKNGLPSILLLYSVFKNQPENVKNKKIQFKKILQTVPRPRKYTAKVILIKNHFHPYKNEMSPYTAS